MCGIAGAAGPRVVPRPVLERMTACLRHRGPDSGGFYERDTVAFGIRRLRIIDLETGDQPIESACSGATIVYNGELYNYRELRRELEGSGHRFRTASDTEVVLHFYEEHGTAFARLNGIFAFAIHDPRADRLLLARDHMGVKPLYYSRGPDNTLVFGSEQKAVLASGLVERRVAPDALERYLAYGHATGGSSMYEGITKLPTGSTLTWANGSVTVSPYWDLVERSRRWEPGARPPHDEVASLIEDAVERNMIADVPVGSFLSGGVDSSIVTALMRRHTERLRTYSVGFGLPSDETGAAGAVAARLGTVHTAITVSADDAGRTIREVAAIYDEPFADAAAVPTYLMARRAKEDVTVVLTGEGGDELFGGYRRYIAEQAYSVARLLPRSLRGWSGLDRIERIPRLRRFGQALRALAHDERLARYTAWTESFHAAERQRLLGRPSDALGRALADAVPDPSTVADDVTAMAVFELRTWLVDGYLEKVDKATMAASLEARVPLLDHRLVELMALAPRDWKVSVTSTKVLLRELARRWVDDEITRRPKRGFGPPIGQWLRTSLRDEVGAMTVAGSALHALVDPDEVQAIVSGFRAGEWREGQVWSLLMLSLWAERERAGSPTMAA